MVGARVLTQQLPEYTRVTEAGHEVSDMCRDKLYTMYLSFTTYKKITQVSYDVIGLNIFY